MSKSSKPEHFGREAERGPEERVKRMKVRVSIPNAYMTMDLEEESALMAFRKMAELLCSYGTGAIRQEKTQVPSPEAGLEKPEPASEPEETEAAEDLPEAQDRLEKIRPSKAMTKYSGFLYIKCPECGKEKGFAVRKEKATDHYHCDNCGARSEFKEPLVQLLVNCECGKRLRYLTNMAEEAFDINCLGCGAPVAVQWNEKKKLYETIR